jgi:endoplasmic reticulum-Golgi intermediate compartment protein 3
MPKFNVTHTLHLLSFGEPFPGSRNPLDGTSRESGPGSGVFMYFIKIIPTVYLGEPRIKRCNSRWVQCATRLLFGHSSVAGVGATSLKTNQYSVTSQYRAAIVNGQRQNVLPGIFFVYDISPFQVTVTEHTTPTLQVTCTYIACTSLICLLS